MHAIFAMTVDPWILAFSLVTVAATIGMGLWSARTSKTAGDFFVAGRSVSVGWNASAISGEYLSAASFMGIAGMVMKNGYDALWYPVCYACGYLFLLLFIAGPLRRFGAYTIPDFAEGRYDSPLFRKIAVIFVLFIGFFYTMPQMKGAGTTLAYVFPGLDYRWGVILVGAVITLNVALGGMKGITLVQAFQYWIKMFAISVPVFVLMSVYGHYGRQLGYDQPLKNAPLPPGIEYKAKDQAGEFALGSVSGRTTTGPAPGSWTPFQKLRFKFQEIFDRNQVSLLSTNMNFSDTVGQYAAWTGQKISYPMKLADYPLAFHPDGVKRKQAHVRDIEACLAKHGLVLFKAAQDNAFIVPSDEVETRLPGYLAFSGIRKSLPEKAPKDETWLNPFGPLTTKAAKAAKLSDAQARPYSLLYTYSLIIALVCGTAGLPHILVRFYTNPDGAAAKRTTMWVMILIGVFYVFPPVLGVLGRNLLPELYSAVGAKGTDKVVLELPSLLNQRYAGLGSVLSGIACAGAFAAFMSTFSGLLVSMTGALAHDVYGRILRPNSTSEQRLRAFKVCAVIIGVVAILLGMQVEKLDINFMVGQAFAIAAASYFPLLFLSTWWRGMTMKGAACGMLGGGLLALMGISLTSFSDLKWIQLDAFWSAHPLVRILCEQPAIWAVPLAILLMIVVSKLTRSEVPSDVRMKMLVLHAPEKLGLKQEYIQEQQGH
jgi:cation/acetate symporter